MNFDVSYNHKWDLVKWFAKNYTEFNFLKEEIE
jgi:hypothetical protein